MSDEPIIPTFIPPLITLLADAERRKRSPLTRDEVMNVRDHGICITLPQSEASRMATARGYADIDPEQVWEQWQIVRQQLPTQSEPNRPQRGRFRFLIADTCLNDFPTSSNDRHEAFIEIFGRQLFSVRNEVLEETRAAIVAPQDDRDQMGTLNSTEYTAVANLPLVAQEAALNLSRKAVDSFLRHILTLFAHNGLSIDIALGSEHAIAYEVLLKVIRKDNLETVEQHAVNKDGRRVIGDYYGLWLNRHKDA